jgi:hypothetical protein
MLTLLAWVTAIRPVSGRIALAIVSGSTSPLIASIATQVCSIRPRSTSAFSGRRIEL